MEGGNTNGHVNGHTNGPKSDHTDNHTNGDTNGQQVPYHIREKRLGEPLELRIITIGAGASGLNLAYQLNRHMRNVTHVVYEKNPEVGGTWYENRYPGYSDAPQILEYFRMVAKKHELYRYIKLSHEVIGANWDDVKGIWTIKVKELTTGDVFEDWCHFMISGSGILNNWKWPNIPGLHTFKGQLLHSAAWDMSADWRGKTVAVLGCGSSGVQVVPTIQPDVKQLITFIRTPTWITAGFAQSKAGPNGANFAFSESQKQDFRTRPDAYLKYRKELESEMNRRFQFIIKDSPEQAEAVRFSINEMTTKLGVDSPLLKHLIPTFSVGCRRPTPGNGYLEALTKDNVRVVTDAITEIVPDGIKTATDEIIKVDMFICATGFDISFCPRYPVVGRHNTELGKQWKERPTAYLSLAAPNFPNHFMFLGPNAPIGHGSVLPIVEHSTKYIIRMLHKCQTQGIKAVEAKQEAVDDFTEHVDTFVERAAWTSHCRSWFKNDKIDGPIVALHPGSRVHWFHMLENPRFEDYNWTPFDKNRFFYLGNGFSTKEAEDRDSTYYFDHPDEGFETISY
ncbi:hypothetical protein H2202_002984 [Exophiala xenobiotica]|nr:hypothetical protein H2202_002984 [Exophiala xenobiotica]KAK5385849.1 hypothetical protein LTS13_001484 [Exophiala xenobiotica]KAK5394188.1 hypothetical protein LTR79_008401 [Exophiala xenobiotica]KAK5405083.1 hypothetical protein LTR90_011086 [Exophiala xenobiotica]KAK5463268.1 hypothetical protein LTR20_005349 [Exophiala xenobiotica]